MFLKSLKKIMDSKQIGKIMAFLCSIPPNSNLRLMLQLALAVSVPQEKYEKLLLPMQQDKDLRSLLEENDLLMNLINADGFLEESEQNMLMEAMDKVGIVVPMKMQMIDVLTQELTANVVKEIEEIETSGTVEGIPLLWTQT
ncbi:hypothetical protein MiSe_37150 [Microseira wollei NIES-4236]|uniref:Co-chaperone DjlA N-terminal domain-containing protein n=2 Tax=Microseira wollei TaxID=467598 RepID=A0AAV3XDQ3_9CYAN|nr:hypothetical protein MiSe_37150 [Microseira wollei NIES-4236]